MTNLRVFKPALDSFESLLKRLMTPMHFEGKSHELDMRVNVSERDNAYTVRADLPGVKKDGINVRIDGNIVQIDGEVKEEKDTNEGGKLLGSESYYGSISRAFTLAHDVDEARAAAKFENGARTLPLLKKATSTSKKLIIQ